MTMHIDLVEADVDISPADPSGPGAPSDAGADPEEVERLRSIVLQILEEEIERIQRR